MRGSGGSARLWASCSWSRVRRTCARAAARDHHTSCWDSSRQLLSPIALVYHLLKIPSFVSCVGGTTAIARWTVSADEYRLFSKADAQLEAETRTTNFYEPLRTVPASGVEVIFASDAVLIGDGYFPLSTIGGRRVHRVRIIQFHSADDRVRDDSGNSGPHIQRYDNGRSDFGNASRARRVRRGARGGQRPSSIQRRCRALANRTAEKAR